MVVPRKLAPPLPLQIKLEIENVGNPGSWNRWETFLSYCFHLAFCVTYGKYHIDTYNDTLRIKIVFCAILKKKKHQKNLQFLNPKWVYLREQNFKRLRLGNDRKSHGLKKPHVCSFKITRHPSCRFILTNPMHVRYTWTCSVSFSN